MSCQQVGWIIEGWYYFVTWYICYLLPRTCLITCQLTELHSSEMTEDAYSLHLPPAASAHNKPEEAPEQGEAQQVTEPLQAEAEVELEAHHEEWEDRDSFHERTSGSYTDSYEEGSMAGSMAGYRQGSSLLLWSRHWPRPCAGSRTDWWGRGRRPPSRPTRPRVCPPTTGSITGQSSWRPARPGPATCPRSASSQTSGGPGGWWADTGPRHAAHTGSLEVRQHDSQSVSHSTGRLLIADKKNAFSCSISSNLLLNTWHHITDCHLNVVEEMKVLYTVIITHTEGETTSQHQRQPPSQCPVKVRLRMIVTQSNRKVTQPHRGLLLYLVDKGKTFNWYNTRLFCTERQRNVVFFRQIKSVFDALLLS